ncbi:MAG: hypothetical protein HWN65_00940 [Candidatus Helarchaeota archaeon]|nr:hypothetical protein [Candidatus Helarchaeota archaeon]
MYQARSLINPPYNFLQDNTQQIYEGFSVTLKEEKVIKMNKISESAPFSEEGKSISELIKQIKSNIGKGKAPIFEIDLDFDFNTDFIFSNIKTKVVTIKKVEKINFAQVFDDDF